MNGVYVLFDESASSWVVFFMAIDVAFTWSHGTCMWMYWKLGHFDPYECLNKDEIEYIYTVLCSQLHDMNLLIKKWDIGLGLKGAEQ